MDAGRSQTAWASRSSRMRAVGHRLRSVAAGVGSVVLIVACSLAPVRAVTVVGADSHHLRVAQSGSISAESAARIAKASSGGEVLSVTPIMRNGTRHYRVKVLLPGGRVKVFRVNGRTGRLGR